MSDHDGPCLAGDGSRAGHVTGRYLCTSCASYTRDGRRLRLRKSMAHGDARCAVRALRSAVLARLDELFRALDRAERQPDRVSMALHLFKAAELEKDAGGDGSIAGAVLAELGYKDCDNIADVMALEGGNSDGRA